MAPLTERDANARPTPTKSKDEKAVSSKKRKSELDEVLESVELPANTVMNWDANQIRSKIRSYINSGEMKVGEFQDKIGVTPSGYSAFMRQSGPNAGIGSNTFFAAFEFFKKRELAGLKMPRKKTKICDKSDPKSTDKEKKVDNNEKDKFDVSDIKLDGENEESVPIFDTCDDIRKKVNAHLREPGITQAAFLREIGKTFPVAPSQGMSPSSMKTFLSAKGPDKHSHSPIFYAAYVYFEKLRLKNNKAKTKKRQEMEDVWPAGFDRSKHSGYLTMQKGETVRVDQYGQYHFSGGYNL